MSVVVCQIPCCTTSQEEIEEELQTYLAGYCQACGKNREGRLCGCAFPCSLTFRGQMLIRIHEILGVPVPLTVKAIQVCYKHPELLKQARETCIALRDSAEEPSTHLSSDGTDVLGKESEANKQVLGMSDMAEDVTSIVYTDEAGREQSLVGQIVYTTGEDGEGNIIIQEVDASELVDNEASSRIMKIQFGEDGGFVVAEDGGDGGGERDEELEQRLEEELEGREAKLEEELEEEQGKKNAMTRIQFIGYSPPRSEEQRRSSVDVAEVGGVSGETGENVTSDTAQADMTSTLTEARVKQIHKELVAMEEDDFDGLSDDGGSDKGDEDPNLLKIQYKEYQLQILSREMRPLLSRNCLCDVEFVCQDGRELSSGLVLGAISPLLRSLLDGVPRLDQYKTLMLPDVAVEQVRLLNKLIFEEERMELEEEKEEVFRGVAQLLGCSNLLKVTEKKTVAPPSPVPGGSPAAPCPSEEEDQEKEGKRKREGEKTKGPKAKRPKASSDADFVPPTLIRLEKSDLNTDYMDESGLVRLSSTDEMAMHYCLVCEGKFKKYNQAITHYDSAHNLLAALACDQCDDTFRDMFSCVKHRHAVHGEFDPNLQCYICKEVMYSRFRLTTHIKETHKSEYGEFVCRSCGMKFAARHYLDVHQEDSHNDQANTCSICGKTFSGKRYLTMHMKANHEATSGGGEDLTCQDCERVFPSSRDAAYHASKVHGAPRPPGSFEDCDHCDKWFRTRGELSQHVSRIHSGVKNNKMSSL